MNTIYICHRKTIGRSVSSLAEPRFGAAVVIAIILLCIAGCDSDDGVANNSPSDGGQKDVSTSSAGAIATDSLCYIYIGCKYRSDINCRNDRAFERSCVEFCNASVEICFCDSGLVLADPENHNRCPQGCNNTKVNRSACEYCVLYQFGSDEGKLVNLIEGPDADEGLSDVEFCFAIGSEKRDKIVSCFESSGLWDAIRNRAEQLRGAEYPPDAACVPGDAGADFLDGGGKVSDGSSEGGGDAGDDLFVSKFQFSDCKESYSSDYPAPELFTGRASEPYAGLQCIAWDVSNATEAGFDLVNIVEMCGFPPNDEDESLWRGYARQDENGLVRLFVEWDFTDPNACGSCLQDFSFEIDGLKEIDKTLPIEISIRNCTSYCEWSNYSVALQIEDNPKGILCKYVKNLSNIGESGITPGKLHMPPDQGKCDTSLKVIKTSTGEEICAATCSKSADCPLPEILSCQDSACRLIKEW